MYKENRPTCVTVIGWVWIILGGMMTFSALMAFFMSLTMMDNISKDIANLPVIFKYFHWLALGQIIVAITGLISGINFLKLKRWARGALEALTWLILLLSIGFTIFWIITWNEMAGKNAPPSFAILGSIMGVVSMAFYVVPLGIMLKYLRGEKVKCAFEDTVGLIEPNQKSIELPKVKTRF